jgi:hypothetical protein
VVVAARLASGLSRRERSALPCLPEPGRRGLDAAFEVPEEQLIRPVDPLGDIPCRLGTELIPEAVFIEYFKFSYVFLDMANVWTPFKKP